MENTFPTWPGWTTTRIIYGPSNDPYSLYEIQKDMQGTIMQAAMKVIPRSSGSIQNWRQQGHSDAHIAELVRKQQADILGRLGAAQNLAACPQILCHNDVLQIPHSIDPGYDIILKMELHQPLTCALPQDVPVQSVVTMAKDLCRALEYSTSKGITHGNICPQEIFVTSDGHFRLGGFGSPNVSSTRFAAPEVYRHQPCGILSDIYALGLVMYWMLDQRKLPFMPLPVEHLSDSFIAQAEANRFAGRSIPRPASGSSALQAVVMKALAFDPAKRYQTPTEMLMALDRLDPPQLTLSPPERKKRSNKGKRKKATNLVITIVCLLLLVGTVISAYHLVNKEDPPATNQTTSATIQTVPATSELCIKDYSGMELEQAYEELQELGVTILPSGKNDPSTRAGVVLSQTPAPGTPIKEGDEVSLIVSMGDSAGKELTVTLDPAGGDVKDSSVTRIYGEAYGQLPYPTRKGHSFNGWFTKPEGGRRAWKKTWVLSWDTDHTLYAQWIANIYTVTLDPNGGTIDTSSVDILYGTNYGELPQPTREGYTFEGWYTVASGGERIWKDTTLTTDDDHTLYAHWKKN